MLKTNVTTNIYGQSYITDTHGTEKQVAYMSATIDQAKTVNINKSIQDISLYNSNKVSVEADFAEFEKQVYAIATPMV